MSKLLKTAQGSETIPSDCWESAFHHLNSAELKAVALTWKDFLRLVKKSLNVVNPDVTLFSKQIKRFTHLKRIDLRDFQGDLDEAIREIARSGLCLENLYLRGTAFETQSLKELGSNPNIAKNLKVLHCLQNQRFNDDNDLAVIANSFPNLEQLQIGHKESFVASSVYSVFSTHVLIMGSGNVDHVVNVTEHGIGLLLRNMPKMERLCIAHIDKSWSAINIENSIGHTKSLTHLAFVDMDVSDNLLMEIGKLKLKYFSVSRCRNYTVSGLLAVSKYLNVLRIEDANIRDLDVEFLLGRGDLANLTCTEIISNQVTSSTLLLLLMKCSSLVDIKLTAPNFKNGLVNNIPLTIDELAILVTRVLNHNLRRLDLSRCSVTDRLLLLIGWVCPNLELLDLSFCSLVTSRGVEAIFKGCRRLTGLRLRGYMKAKMIEENSEVPETLKVVSLEDSQIDDEGLDMIRTKCPQLISFNLIGCQNVTLKSIKRMVKNIKTLTQLLFKCEKVNSGELLEWMLSKGHLASLKEINLPRETLLTDTQKEAFLQHGCLIRGC
ncbi:Leucine-rich repeat, cysteine-containing subtype [Corchorus olitorius]|uniref:Leucine-rich repeat, cysteine-containing subtype n=1 Tax=Corchorus olitorius TaxID=93759 RepID=A0A1R3H3T8_9ROSI|nr:Leucine-rich repeat, cysteine-containing subtype [Corchorus olitorius]